MNGGNGVGGISGINNISGEGVIQGAREESVNIPIPSQLMPDYPVSLQNRFPMQRQTILQQIAAAYPSMIPAQIETNNVPRINPATATAFQWPNGTTAATPVMSPVQAWPYVNSSVANNGSGAYNGGLGIYQYAHLTLPPQAQIGAGVNFSPGLIPQLAPASEGTVTAVAAATAAAVRGSVISAEKAMKAAPTIIQGHNSRPLNIQAQPQQIQIDTISQKNTLLTTTQAPVPRKVSGQESSCNGFGQEDEENDSSRAAEGSKVLLCRIDKIPHQVELAELASTSSLQQVSSQKLLDAAKLPSSLDARTVRDNRIATTASMDEKVIEDRPTVKRRRKEAVGEVGESTISAPYDNEEMLTAKESDDILTASLASLPGARRSSSVVTLSQPNTEVNRKSSYELSSKRRHVPAATAADSTGDYTVDHQRVTHSLTEKKRRDRLNKCFDILRLMVPSTGADGVKSSDKVSVLTRAIERINALQQQVENLQAQVEDSSSRLRLKHRETPDE